jgi:hypothetical protein
VSLPVHPCPHRKIRPPIETRFCRPVSPGVETCIWAERALDQLVKVRILLRQPTPVHESLLSSREPREELAPLVDVAPHRDGVARQPWCHPLELRFAHPQEARCLLRVHDFPAAGERLGGSLDHFEDRGLQEGVQAGVLVDPHTLQSPLSGPACRISWVTSKSRLRRSSESCFSGLRTVQPGPYSRHVPVRLG